MTTNFRTQLLLGFTILAGTLTGCLIETTDSGGSPSGTCLDNQYFNVRWEVDNNVSMFSCAATPPSHVVLSTNTGDLLQVGAECADGRFCADGTSCNWSGSTYSGVPVGTTVVTASLVGDPSGTLLSSSSAPQAAIRPCAAVELNFEFPIN